jgi:hypothetical protein
VKGDSLENYRAEQSVEISLQSGFSIFHWSFFSCHLSDLTQIDLRLRGIHPPCIQDTPLRLE